MPRSGCQVSVVETEGIGKADGVEALQGDGEALVKEGCFAGVVSDGGYAMTNFRNEGLACCVDGSHGFKSQWEEQVVRAMSAYLLSLRWAAASAADAALVDEMATYDGATVSVTVTSHVALRPSRHGMSVRPSGRLPSDLVSPCGSLTEGTLALVMARQIRSLM